VQDVMASLLNSIKHLRRTLPAIFKRFQKLKEERILSNSFYKTYGNFMTKQDKECKRK
jgi:hypothetical protein